MSARFRFHDASEDDVTRLVRPLVAARLFPDAASVWEAWRADPWRFQTTTRGDLALLEVWREHLPILWVRALWCPDHLLRQAVRQLGRSARERGYTELLSPLVPYEDIGVYERAGMVVREAVETFALDLARAEAPEPLPAAQVVIRQATRADADALLDIEARSFDEFWRYDRRHVQECLSDLRTALAVGSDGPVGYSVSGVQADEGTLGRLAVLPEWRRRGVGSALASEAVGFLARAGAKRVTLSTQRDNQAARALYTALGFRPTGNRYAFLRY